MNYKTDNHEWMSTERVKELEAENAVLEKNVIKLNGSYAEVFNENERLTRHLEDSRESNVTLMEIIEGLRDDNEALTAQVANLTANLETAVGALETGEMPF